MNEDFHYVAGLERRVTALEQDLAEARDKVEALHVLLQARDAETDALRAETKAVARFYYIEGWNDRNHDGGCDFDTAWSRYQW